MNIPTSVRATSYKVIAEYSKEVLGDNLNLFDAVQLAKNSNHSEELVIAHKNKYIGRNGMVAFSTVPGRVHAIHQTDDNFKETVRRFN